MSLQQLFTEHILKPLVLEFLRRNAIFANLPRRYKRPFKAVMQDRPHSKGSVILSDGFFSLPAELMPVCLERLSKIYPDSITTRAIDGFAVSVTEWSIHYRKSPRGPISEQIYIRVFDLQLVLMDKVALKVMPYPLFQDEDV